MRYFVVVAFYFVSNNAYAGVCPSPEVDAGLAGLLMAAGAAYLASHRRLRGASKSRR
jgi:hypothetical protein